MAKLRGSVAAVCLWGATIAGCTPWRDEVHTWAPEQDAISRELDAQARAIVAGDGALDVGPVWAMTRGARVVGVGEPGQGLALFHRLMQAMVERAAADAAPLVVALDVCFVDGLELDAWGRGTWNPPDPDRFDPHAFDAAGSYRPLLAWIREHNQFVAPQRAIQIAGVDGCLDARGLDPLAAYFVDLDPEFAASVPGLLAPVRALTVPSRRTPGHVAEARAGLAELRARLLARREAQVAAHGAASHAVALRLVWLAERRVDAYGDTGSTPRAQRGRVMADTVAWLAEQRPDARVVVLADNEDTHRASPSDMGGRLHARFGADYAVVHTTFDSTTYLAQRQRMWAPPGTLEAALRRPGRGYALDVQAAAAGQGSLARYLREEHWTRAYADGLFDQARPGWSTVVPQRDYDVLVHVAFVPQAPYSRPAVGAEPGSRRAAL
ncbi:Erythromycin esterase [Nannocystis exedens]|uniref:Erythromycin esterase n=1 Tax=Nannocystis exedens TaxID=54 RepID=A0A1I2CJC1_9BACT|nr:erythromycin esterase family protein [Nannocystis exedens]PCC68265.1 Erythromycin esterase [Nannocystis exedens]SFE68232.1 Erythromycin esterase [Nannocystis exedens]